MNKYAGRMFLLGAFAMLVGAIGWLVFNKDIGQWTALVGVVLTAFGAKDVAMSAIHKDKPEPE